MKFYCLLFAITIFILSSCDPASNDYYVINNNSDQNIHVYYKPLIPITYSDSIYRDTILPYTSKIIYTKHNFPASPADLKDQFLYYFDTLYINPLDTNYKISKNIHDRMNWDYCENDKCSERKKSIFSEYTLTIANSDF